MSFQQREVGLTGGIATGKSTVCGTLKRLKVPVFSSDEAVHQILRENTSVKEAIQERHPQVVKKGEIDRQALGKIVFDQEEEVQWLETLVHPEVDGVRAVFVKTHSRSPLIVFEIPLLFEVGLEKTCDKTVALVCSLAKQRERALRRPGMTEEKLEGILKRQLSSEKRADQADYVIHTDGSKRQTRHQVIHLIRHCLAGDI